MVEYKTIGEVAREVDLPEHVLRFWETQFKQIKPVKRRGDRRFYSDSNVELIKTIKSLLHGNGYSIKGANIILSGMKVNMSASKKQPKPVNQPDLFGANNGLDESSKEALKNLLAELKQVQDLLNNSNN
jgi:DNA-binding transcriptional MerR regulator